MLAHHTSQEHHQVNTVYTKLRAMGPPEQATRVTPICDGILQFNFLHTLCVRSWTQSTQSLPNLSATGRPGQLSHPLEHSESPWF